MKERRWKGFENLTEDLTNRLRALALGVLGIPCLNGGGNDPVDHFLALLKEATGPRLTSKFMGEVSLGLMLGLAGIYGVIGLIYLLSRSSLENSQQN